MSHPLLYKKKLSRESCLQVLEECRRIAKGGGGGGGSPSILNPGSYGLITKFPMINVHLGIIGGGGGGGRGRGL